MSDVIPWISQDTWSDILKKLPVKTLGKCRCVCKSWNSLSVSPSFMAAHLKDYTQNEANSLFSCKEKSTLPGYTQYVFFRDSIQFMDWNSSSLHTSDFPFRLLRGPVNRWHCFQLVGSVYGLLCLSEHFNPTTSDRIVIWNPLLQKSIKLPLSLTDDKRSVAGFGYDDRKNDHRVVKISHLPVEDGEPPTTPLIEICSVKERAWKMISADYLVRKCICNISSSNCFFNGVIHWLIQSLSPNCSLEKWMLLFNVMEEVFDKMELPEALVMKHTSSAGNFGIFEYQSKLSVSLCGFTVLDGALSVSCQIWVKGEYDVGSSWCKILNVLAHDSWPISPVQYLGRDGTLIGFAKKNTGEMTSYDSKTKQIKGVDRYGIGSTGFIAYSESLVLLDQEIVNLTCDELQLY